MRCSFGIVPKPVPDGDWCLAERDSYKPIDNLRFDSALSVCDYYDPYDWHKYVAYNLKQKRGADGFDF